MLRQRRFMAVAMVLSITVFLPAGTTVGAPPELTVRPMPFTRSLKEVSRPIPCGAFLGLKEERYDKAASQVLGSAPAASSDGVAYQVLQALVRKDGTFLRTVMLDPNAKELANFDLEKHLNYYDIPEDPVLLRVYRLGSSSLYAFKARRPTVMPILISPKQGKYFLDVPGQNTPLCAAAVDINDALATNPADFSPLTNLDGYRSIDLPSSPDDETSEHGAKLYFRGVQYRTQVFPLTDAEITRLPSTENRRIDGAIAFYARLWNTLASGDANAFADAMLSDRDAAFVRKADKEKIGEYFFVAGKNPQPRYVNYILYSDDVFWMFTQLSPGKYTQKSLIYHIVIWDKASQSYKLVRPFPYFDPLTSLTQWKPLASRFINDIINAEPLTPPEHGGMDFKRRSSDEGR